MPPTRLDDESGRRPVIDRRGLLVGAAASLALAACSSADRGVASTPGTDATPAAGAGAGAATGPPGSATGSTSSAAPGTAPEACVLTPELTAGPYHLDGPAIRRDITEGRPGVPLDLRLRVLDASCRPVANAAVDVWHCDAGGEYSGFNGNSLAATGAGGSNDRRFLRGVQLTDDDGAVAFASIFPGWYEGRSVHIHLSVIIGGEAGSTYGGGHIAHTGQLFFDEDLTARMMDAEPYVGRTGSRTTNEQDSIFGQAGPSAVATTRARAGGRPADGLTAELTCVVDPAATPPPAPMF